MIPSRCTLYLQLLVYFWYWAEGQYLRNSEKCSSIITHTLLAPSDRCHSHRHRCLTCETDTSLAFLFGLLATNWTNLTSTFLFCSISRLSKFGILRIPPQINLHSLATRSYFLLHIFIVCNPTEVHSAREPDNEYLQKQARFTENDPRMTAN